METLLSNAFDIRGGFQLREGVTAALKRNVDISTSIRAIPKGLTALCYFYASASCGRILFLDEFDKRIENSHYSFGLQDTVT